MKNVVKKRSDYKPLFWLTKDTFLEFIIFEKYTIVKSQIIFQKNNSQNINNYNLESHLELNGVDLVTKKFELILDYNPPKNIKIESLKKKSEAVIIPVSPNTSFVKISSYEYHQMINLFVTCLVYYGIFHLYVYLYFL